MPASVHVCGRCVDDVAFAVLSDVPCFAVVFFDPLADEFLNSPEEFQWKIFLREDLQALAVFAVVSFGWQNCS